MPVDLDPHLEPSTCAVLVFECQEGIIGEGGGIPGLVAAVRDSGMLRTLAGLLDAARETGARIYYCTVAKRADGLGNPMNTPLEARLRGAGAKSGLGGPVCAEIAPREGDVVVARQHGMTAFYESGLAPYLKNTGVRTVIPTGVSVNVGILGTTIEAVNRGYTVIVPPDCVAGDPPEYAEQALRYSIRNLAYLAPSDAIADAWRRLAKG